MHKWLRKGSGVFDRLHGGEAECVQIATRKGAGKPRGNKVLLTWRIAIPQSIVQMEIK